MQTGVVNTHSILVVDDDRTIGKLIRYNLQGKDTQVVEATTGLDCLKILHEEKVDLILLDLRLPDFYGWGILSLVRLTESLRHIPVIIVSVEPPNKALVQEFKPDDYIVKPFDIRDLLTKVERVKELRARTESSIDEAMPSAPTIAAASIEDSPRHLPEALSFGYSPERRGYLETTKAVPMPSAEPALKENERVKDINFRVVLAVLIILLILAMLYVGQAYYRFG